MRYNLIRKMDISNGPGVRVSVFLQGCEFHCKNCFNPETWDFEGGEEFKDEHLKKIIDLCSSPNVVGLSILGGEPLHPKNIDTTLKIAKTFKENYPKKSVWVWSGFVFDDNMKKKDVFKYIDVLVDGQYKDELHNPKLKWRGSSNQRVIDIPKTLKEDKVILVENT